MCKHAIGVRCTTEFVPNATNECYDSLKGVVSLVYTFLPNTNNHIEPWVITVRDGHSIKMEHQFGFNKRNVVPRWYLKERIAHGLWVYNKHQVHFCILKRRISQRGLVVQKHACTYITFQWSQLKLVFIRILTVKFTWASGWPHCCFGNLLVHSRLVLFRAHIQAQWRGNPSVTMKAY